MLHNLRLGKENVLFNPGSPKRLFTYILRPILYIRITLPYKAVKGSNKAFKSPRRPARGAGRALGAETFKFRWETAPGKVFELFYPRSKPTKVKGPVCF